MKDDDSPLHFIALSVIQLTNFSFRSQLNDIYFVAILNA